MPYPDRLPPLEFWDTHLLCSKNVIFNNFINDLYYGTKCTFSKFAEDTKREGVTDKLDRYAIQRQVDRLEK